jgi:hypothetical protein
MKRRTSRKLRRNSKARRYPAPQYYVVAPDGGEYLPRQNTRAAARQVAQEVGGKVMSSTPATGPIGTRRTSLVRNSSWHGIDALERREHLIHNRLVGVILDDISKGTLTRARAEEYIHEAQAFIADLEAQHPPGGARGHAGKWKARTLDKLKGYLVRAKKQLGMVANGGCAYCQSPPGRHRWWCKKLAKNSRRRTSRRR